MGEEGRPHGSLSRRKLLKRLGAAGAVAWATPVISSLTTPAHAAGTQPTGSCSECAGDFCAGQTICGESTGDDFPLCPCAQRVDGQGCFCYDDDYCVNRTPCTTQSDCPSGEVCVHTCCDQSIGSAVCFPPCRSTRDLRVRSSVTQSGPSGMRP